MTQSKTINFTLQNGLRVLLLQDQTTPLCVVSVLYNVGSKNEDPDRTGIAHLMEHLMFEGSKNVPDFDHTFQKIGGDSNAYTNSDVTHYYNTLPAQNIATALWVEADRMQSLNINEESLEKQKKIVLEEYHETVFNETYGDLWHKILPELYSNNPYQWPTIGKSLKAIKSINLKDIQSFYKRYYTPSNAILVIGGMLKPKETKALVKQYFGSIMKEDLPPTSFSYNKISSFNSLIEGTANTPRSAFYMAFRMVGRSDTSFYTCDIISDILATGESSRLYKKLVNEMEILTDVQCFVNATFGPGLLIIEGRLSPKTSHIEAEEEVWKILDTLKNETVTKEELIKTKNRIITDRAFSEANIVNKTLNVALFCAMDNLPLYVAEPEIYNNITAKNIKLEAQKIFQKDNGLILRYSPKKSNLPTAPLLQESDGTCF